MNPSRNILVVMDPALRKSPAYERALVLARQSGARLQLVIFDYNPTLVRERFLDPGYLKAAVLAYVKQRRDWLEQLAAELRKEGLDVETGVVWGKPVPDEIVWRALDTRTDMVVKDARVESKLKRILLAPLDWALIRQCPVPLMLVNAASALRPRRIIAAVDPLDKHSKPHDLNDTIVKTAVGLSYEWEAEVHVVHAFEYLPAPAPPMGDKGTIDAQLVERMRERSRKAFLEFAGNYGITPERLHFLDGRPHEVIPEFADNSQTDLVILGSVYRTGLKRAFIGSTAERILDRLNCDLLVLKPEGFTTDLLDEMHRETYQNTATGN